jgi:uncharacterized membrane protein affecting hemolysin expression
MRTHNLSVLASEDSSCPTPSGQLYLHLTLSLSIFVCLTTLFIIETKQTNSVVLAERPPLVGEVSASFSG